MADNITDWEIVSHDSELSDVYWPESESDGGVSDSDVSTLKSGEKGKDYESCSSESEYSALCYDESESESESESERGLESATESRVT